MKQLSPAISFGWLASLLTFPGVILHEWAHMVFCRLSGVRVYKICLFRLGSPAGYVEHEQPRSFFPSLLISIAPFLVNTAFSFGVFIAAICLPRGTGAFLLFWLGLSTALHAFPSREDAENLRLAAQRTWKHNPLALVSFPLVWLIRLAHLPGTLIGGLVYAVFLFLLAALLLHGPGLFLFPQTISDVV